MDKKATTAATTATDTLDAHQLYRDFLRFFYEKEDRKQALKVADRLEVAMLASPDLAASIRGEEIRSLIAEVRGDYATAARSREAEIRKILELHSMALNTRNWDYVSRQFDFSDVSDRLDLLAILYDQNGETDRAIATLEESKLYCRSHNIPFDGQDVLDELVDGREEDSRRNGAPGKSQGNRTTRKRDGARAP